MKKHLSIAIRFSLVSQEQSTAFESGLKLGYEEHKRKILSEENLNFRVNIFKKITLPSLNYFYNQSLKYKDLKSFTVYLVTSDLLSDKFKDILNNLQLEYPFIKIEYQSETDANIKRPLIRQAKRFKEKSLFITMRMDDDDAISKDFYQQFKPYLDEKYSGYAVTLGMGYAMVVDKNLDLLGFYNFYKPKIAICLAYITVIDPEVGMNKYNTVYCLSRHMRVDMRVPTISDCRRYSFIRTVHVNSDLYSDEVRYKEAMGAIDNTITIDHVKSLFTL